ncbi:MAG: hypothetical protein U7123_06780 [Potamolinea sp.]
MTVLGALTPDKDALQLGFPLRTLLLVKVVIKQDLANNIEYHLYKMMVVINITADEYLSFQEEY